MPPPVDWIPEAPKSELGVPPIKIVNVPDNWNQGTIVPNLKVAQKRKEMVVNTKDISTDWCHSCSYSSKWKKNDFRSGFLLIRLE